MYTAVNLWRPSRLLEKESLCRVKGTKIGCAPGSLMEMDAEDRFRFGEKRLDFAR